MWLGILGLLAVVALGLWLGRALTRPHDDDIPRSNRSGPPPPTIGF